MFQTRGHGRYDMKKLFNIFLVFYYIILMMPSHSWAATASVEVIQSSDKYYAGKTYPVVFRIRIIDGWYIHGNEKGSVEIIPSALTFNGTPYLNVKDIRFPEPLKKKFDYLNEPIDIFSGEILISAEVAVVKDAPQGTQHITGRLSYQACSLNACRPPEDVPVELTFTVVSGDTPTQDINTELFLSKNSRQDKKKGIDTFGSDRGLLWTLALIFFGGLALNLSPCIYPMIPITVSYFGGKSGRMKGDTLIHGILYLTGLSVTNSIMGVASALSGSMLGSMLQHPAALIIIAIIMMILGLSFFDLWEIRVPSGLNEIASRNLGGYSGTFFMGLTIGIIAAPCIGPFILGLIAYVGQKGNPFFGFLCFFILSLGMGLPICVLAMFSGAIKRLPLSGDWMVWIRRLMGWVLIAMAAYMISPLISKAILKSALIPVVSIAAGIHLGWVDRAGQAIARFVFVKRISGVLIILLGIGWFYSTLSHNGGIRWQQYDEALLSEAAQEGKPVILDFSADWCVPCRGLDRTVFRNPAVVELSEKFVLMRLDLTIQHAFQEEILKRYQVIGVPTIIFINRDGVEERSLRVESMVKISEFLTATKQALLSAP